MTTRDDWEKLNALADGELSAATRLRLRGRLAAEPDLARAYAEIRALKSRLGTLAAAPAPRRFRLGQWIGMAAAAAAAIALAGAWLQEARTPPTPAELHTSLSGTASAAGIASDAALDLSGSNLSLVAARTVRTTQGEVVAWHYRGPNGCALTILSSRGIIEASWPLSHRWRAGGTSFLALAEGMDPGRFRAVAGYAEAATRRDGRQDDLRLVMRERTATARGCA